jgi:glyoxylase-like metal-dependent hydrolase (beta-lactamase superfamily II)
VITGDVLFIGSCGGVSYSESDPAAMFDSLQRVLGSLPEMTRVYPGHDYGKTPTNTLASEFATNPALRADSLAAFCAYKRVPVPGPGPR